MDRNELLNPLGATNIAFSIPVPNEEVIECLHAIFEHSMDFFADNKQEGIILAIIASYNYGYCMRKHDERK